MLTDARTWDVGWSNRCRLRDEVRAFGVHDGRRNVNSQMMPNPCGYRSQIPNRRAAWDLRRFESADARVVHEIRGNCGNPGKIMEVDYVIVSVQGEYLRSR